MKDQSRSAPSPVALMDVVRDVWELEVASRPARHRLQRADTPMKAN